MPFSSGLKRSMPCTDLNSMGSSISLKELCEAFDERTFSSDDLLRSDKRQRLSPLCVIEEAKHCHPATAALEAALALDDFDDDFSPSFLSMNTPSTTSPHALLAVSADLRYTVHDVTPVTSRMTIICE
jgi:hypothetical protein